MKLRAPYLASALTIAACGPSDLVRDDVGDAPFCSDVERWPAEWSDLEEQLVREVTRVRSEGATCGEQDLGGGVGVVHAPELRCAARSHADDLAHNRTLVHTGSDGSTVVDRIVAAGYGGLPLGEVLAAGELNPESVVAAWLADPEQCAALLDPDLDEVGAGLALSQIGEHPYWVLTLGTVVD